MSDEQEFPEAKIKSRRTTAQAAEVVVSKLWILTVLCALAAGGLVVWQMGGGGPEVDVYFDEGHGLQAGDPVRYRGITVGEVREVVLGDSLEEVIVRIRLAEESAGIAREGAKFWIERPNISIGQVRGLDTLVGGRFVGVLPGPADAPLNSEFYGLEVASAPVSNIAEGLEVTLEGRNRYGLQIGSPVNYRGVTVGQILAVGLTNDSATVEASAYIEPQYRELVRENTKFWSSSGLDVKIGFSGIELDADTLATIAAGGVAFATPDSSSSPAATGQRFELHKSPQEEWLKWQPRVAIGNAALPQGVETPRPILGIRSQSGALGALGAGRERSWLLLMRGDRLLGPTNVLTGAEDEEYHLEVAGVETKLPLSELRQTELLACGQLDQSIDGEVAKWSPRKLRVAKELEPIVITCGSAEKTIPVATHRLTVESGRWIIDPSVPLDESWHGATVLSSHDGLVIGLMVRTNEQSAVALLTKELL